MWKYITVVCAMFLGGCGAHVEYTGRSYPLTNEIDFYFSKQHIEKNYEVMGQAVGKSGDFSSLDSIFEELEHRAREEGADAVLIDSMHSRGKLRGGSLRVVRATFCKYRE